MQLSTVECEVESMANGGLCWFRWSGTDIVCARERVCECVRVGVCERVCVVKGKGLEMAGADQREMIRLRPGCTADGRFVSFTCCLLYV